MPVPTSGVDLSALPSKMKDYALKMQAALLARILISDMSFLTYCQLYDQVQDELPLTEIFVDSVLQPGSKDDFTPKGTASFKARIGKVRSCKVDFRFKPSQITAMWKSYLGQINASTRGNVYDVPFEQHIYECIIKRLKNELQVKAFFKGVYDPTTQNPENVFDGILTKLKVAGTVPAGNIYAGAPITQANAVDQLEAVSDKVPSEYLQEDLVCIVEPRTELLYDRAYRAEFPSLQYNKEFDKKKIEGTNIELVSDPGLAGTGAVLITPRNNFAWLCDSMKKADAFLLERRQRNIELMIDFEAAPEIAIAELVWMNDKALA